MIWEVGNFPLEEEGITQKYKRANNEEHQREHGRNPEYPTETYRREKKPEQYILLSYIQHTVRWKLY